MVVFLLKENQWSLNNMCMVSLVMYYDRQIIPDYTWDTKAFKEFKLILEFAKQQDKEEGNEECATEEKAEWFKKLEERLDKIEEKLDVIRGFKEPTMTVPSSNFKVIRSMEHNPDRGD